MVRLKTQMGRERALVNELFALGLDSRRWVFIGLLGGKGLREMSSLLPVGYQEARRIGRELAADGLTVRTRWGKTVLTASGKRAALAALQPLKAAVMAGASQADDDLF